MPLKHTVVRETTNLETGEILHLATEETIKTNRRRQSNLIDEHFAFVFPRALATAKLTAQELWTLLLLVATVDIETGISNYRIKDIAAQLDISEPRLSLIISSLHKKQAVQKLRRGQLRINPDYLWRGSLAARRDIILEARNGKH